ncbi:AAA-like domain-containing protein [Leptodesmis sichuanensis]|uniref:AAA-like domain-containing protein n=1 Tax=Leptodesmis sichuanensis TaxID=2906798 RepID=UPI001F1B75FC|nr:AAA-like domain-containing protein [Leptodesmis sichuanensis]UIE37271.1 AAA-like domain-containing protein [Leptodesmis sichuanensis A121]
MNRSTARRRRGVILTPQGLQKLVQARTEAERQFNDGKRFTLEHLSDLTGISVDSLTRVFKAETGVDRETLKHCFAAFDLVLSEADYFQPGVPEPLKPQEEPESLAEIDFPDGQVSLNSPLYVERFAFGDPTRESLEMECYRAIERPGILIRIKAPRLMGKTSLVNRILHHAETLGCHAISIRFQLADKAIFQDLERFLQWFCANVGLGLRLPNRFADYWDAIFGSKISCKMYFEEYLLAQATAPIALALDDIDRLFQYPDLADEFFGLLRAWHEEAKNRDIWRKLRLVIAHSTQVYIPLSTNKSPFNVGFPVELPPFTPEQIQDLAERHQLDWSTQETQQLLALVGGYPYLVRLAFYHLWRGTLASSELLQLSPAAIAIYQEHLQYLLWNLEQEPQLWQAFAQVLQAAAPVELELITAFKLQSMGLVHLQDKHATVSCELYRRYFRDRLQPRA